MKLWQVAVVSVVAGFGLPALAQIAAHSEMRSEIEARIEERLGRFDINHDGVVTREEMKSFADARMKARTDDLFAAIDTDRNGSISRAEFDADRARDPRMADRGPPLPEMMPPPPGGPGGPGMMMMAKTGDDGRIVIADVVKQALARFDAADTNKDGTISAEERKAARLKWRETNAPPAL